MKKNDYNPESYRSRNIVRELMDMVKREGRVSLTEIRASFGFNGYVSSIVADLVERGELVGDKLGNKVFIWDADVWKKNYQGKNRIRCLRCRRFFNSENVRTNRICENCKANKDFDAPTECHVTEPRERKGPPR